MTLWNNSLGLSKKVSKEEGLGENCAAGFSQNNKGLQALKHFMRHLCWIGFAAAAFGNLATATPDPSAKPPSQPSQEMAISHERYAGLYDETEDLGTYKVHLGFAKPSFTNKIKGYDKLYGSEVGYPSFAVDHFLFRGTHFACGYNFKIAHYGASGHAALKSQTEVVKAPERTSLTLIPYHLAFVGEWSPLSHHSLVFSFWTGYEELYFQEVRMDSASMPPRGWLLTGFDAFPSRFSSATLSSGHFINSGWNTHLVFGMQAHISITGLDPQHSRSLNRAMGLKNIYVAPFIEVASSMGLQRTLLGGRKVSSADFARTSLGLAFTFESER